MLIRDYTDLLDPDCLESLLIAADWLEEQGRYQESLALRLGPLFPETLFCFDDYGYSSGYSIGSGSGRGYGYGYGDDYGYGYGDDYGYGHGQGEGTNSALLSSNYLALSSHVNS